MTTMNEADFNWLVEHADENRKRYLGKWIAVYRGEVIAVGDTAPEADRKAMEKAPEGQYVLQVVTEPVDIMNGELQVAAD